MKISPKLALAALLVALTSSVPLYAQEKAAAKKVVTIEGISEYHLPNGCKVLLFPDPASSNVTVNMTVLVGSRHEGYGESGMAHLLEHMVFKGSKEFPDIDKALQKLGDNYNGTTWTDRTNYYETFAASDENVEFAIRMEADRLVNSFIKREDLMKEFTVVRNEFERGENSPENVLNQRMMAVAFEWHNYGKSTIGNRSDIERVPIDNLQAFYRKHYQPDNVVVIVAGKFDEAKTLQHIVKHFGVIARPSRKLDPTYTEEPAQDGERSVILRRVGNVAVAGLMYHIPAGAHEDHPAVEMLGSVLGDNTPSGRLYKALVETKKASRVSADVTTWHDPGILELTIQVAEQNTPESLRDLAISLVEGISKNPVTAEEVDRAKRKYLAAREMAMTKSQRICLELSEWVGAGDWRLLFVHRDRVAKVTPADVNRVAAKYLASSNRTAGIFIPSKEVTRTPVPPTPDINAIVKDYKGGKGIASGEAFDPTPENLQKRLEVSTLSSGVKVGMIAKKTRGETVVGSLTLRFGNEQSLKDYIWPSQFVGGLLKRGTKKHTRVELEDELDKLASKINVSSGTGSLSVAWETKRKELPRVLELVREILREPSFPQKEFEIMKRNSKQSLEKGLTDPQALAQRALVRELNPFPKENIRYKPTIEEDLASLEKLKLDDVIRLYNDQIGGAWGEAAIVGDFNPKEVLPQLDAIVSNWKTKTPYERLVKMPNFSVKGRRKTIETPDKENAIFISGLLFEMNDLSPDFAALTVGNQVLGSGFTSRLMDRLRQKEGLCYGAGSFHQVDSQDKAGVFMSYAICNPGNMEKVDSGTLEEIRKITKEGVSEDELGRAKTSIIEEFKVGRGRDSAVAAMIVSNLYLGREFSYYSHLENKIRSLATGEVNQVLSRYIQPDRLVIIRAGDFKKKQKQK